MSGTINTLLGVVFGFLASVLTTIVSEHRQVKRENKALAWAYASEIAAILAIAETRRYFEILEKFAVAIEKTGQTQWFAVALSEKYKYTNVYENNASKVGQLPPEIAKDIVSFYTNTFSILDDFQYLSSASISHNSVQVSDCLRRHRELLQLMNQTKVLGQSIIQQVNETFS